MARSSEDQLDGTSVGVDALAAEATSSTVNVSLN